LRPERASQRSRTRPTPDRPGIRGIRALLQTGSSARPQWSPAPETERLGLTHGLIGWAWKRPGIPEGVWLMRTGLSASILLRIAIVAKRRGLELSRSESSDDSYARESITGRAWSRS